MKAAARAHSNIALVKYWGKADFTENLPAVPSLSLTLDVMFSETTVTQSDAAEDSVELDGQPITGRPAARIAAMLDRFRTLAGSSRRLDVKTRNNFPTAAGLASSASGFAALALATSKALDLSLSPSALSDQARRSSASAARSLFGGYVQLELGARSAEQVLPASAFPLSLLVAVTAAGPKAVGSTEAMSRTATTSPYYASWVETSPGIFRAAKQALLEGRLDALGQCMEHSTLLMHASMLGSVPPILYMNAGTLAVMNAVRTLRAEGVPAYFTMDAGPHVKVLTEPQHAAQTQATLQATTGVQRVLLCGGGPDAHEIEPF